MNKDEFGEIINGSKTYDFIVDKLKNGEAVLIGWTDEEYSHYDILFKLGAYKEQENSIPKQKIKDKIEEYKNLIDDISESEQYSHEIPLYKHDIQVLQELLEDK